MELGKETEMGDDYAASGWGESEEAEAGQRAPTATPTAAAVIAAAASFPPAAILPRQGARTRQQPRCLTLTASLEYLYSPSLIPNPSSNPDPGPTCDMRRHGEDTLLFVRCEARGPCAPRSMYSALVLARGAYNE